MKILNLHFDCHRDPSYEGLLNSCISNTQTDTIVLNLLIKNCRWPYSIQLKFNLHMVCIIRSYFRQSSIIVLNLVIENCGLPDSVTVVIAMKCN